MIVSISNNPISGEGFLGTGAPLVADLNLIVQLLMGAALLIGTFLAGEYLGGRECLAVKWRTPERAQRPA